MPGSGDVTSDITGGALVIPAPYRAFVTRLDVSGSAAANNAVVAFGDSITEGTLSGLDAHATYPEVLSVRLRESGAAMSVVNAGIGGNTLLPCIADTVFGASATTRFDRDVLDVPNVAAVIIMERGNELRYCGRTAPEVAAGLQQLVDKALGAGLRVLVGTYPPRVSPTVVPPGLMPDSFGDDERQQLNEWIRTSLPDTVTVVDFDAALRGVDGRPEHRGAPPVALDCA